MPEDLLVRCVATEAAYFELGNEVRDLGLARVVRNPATPEVWDSNCLTRVRADGDDIDVVLSDLDHWYADVSHRSVKVDPFTPTAMEARLLLEGFRSDTMIHLVLPPSHDIRVRPGAAEVTVREVRSDSDWQSLTRLARADHEEAARREGRVVWSHEVTAQMVTRKRLRSADLPYFMASCAGVDVAHSCAWVGTEKEKVGMVEDLFTDPAFRHRGIATTLIAHAVAYTRGLGAGPVMIGAAADDTPRVMYAALGFRPLFVTRSYVRQDGNHDQEP